MNMWPTSGPEGAVTIEDRLKHIVLAIGHIHASLSNNPLDDLRNNMAVERLLEIVAVASDRLPATYKMDSSVDWKSIAEIGEQLEHARDRIPPATLSNFSEQILPSLKAFAERRLSEASPTRSP